MSKLDDPDTLSLAREVAAVLTTEGLDPLLIGAGALAAHGWWLSCSGS